MKKKIILLLIFIVSFMEFGIEANAEEHELLYSVDSLNIESSSKIKMNGWAFVHNYNQCGGSGCTYDFKPTSGVMQNINDFISREQKVAASKDYDYVAYYFSKNGTTPYKLSISINIRESNKTTDPVIYSSNCSAYGAGCTDGVINLEYVPTDLFSWMCNEVGSECQGYITNNVGFNATIDLSKLDAGKNYYFFIGVRLNNGYVGEKTIGVSKAVVPKKFDTIEGDNGKSYMYSFNDGSKIKLSNLYSVVKNINNLGREGKIYKFDDNNVLFHKDSYGSFISGGKYTITAAYDYDDYKIISEKAHSYLTLFYCFNDGSCGPASWFDTESEEGFKITKEPPNDHICNVEKGVIDACTGGSVENNCSKMTVYASVNGQTISAVVSIKESSTISPGEDENFVDNYNSYFGIDYSKYNIVRGKTFHYALTYTNTASWSFVERNYGNVSESDGDKVIRDKMKDYYKEINKEDFAAKVSIKSNDREEFNAAGIWDCKEEGGTKKEFASGSTTLICKYELKYLNVDGNGKDTYNESESSTSIGRNFYIPSLYNKDKLTWEISGPELTTVEVRTDKVNKNVTSSLLKIEINSNSNKCYINVVGSNVTPDTSGDPGYNPDTVYKDDKLYVYRSVSVNDPFPDGNIPENWNNVNLINRLKGSYQNISNPDYETVPLTTSVVKQIRSLDTIYTKWDDTITSSADNSGNNNFVRNANYFNIIRGKHCKFGLYKPECDERVR